MALCSEFIFRPLPAPDGSGHVDAGKRVGSREARIYGGLVLDLRQRGHPIPLNAVWIAACSEDAGSDLLTSDHHFKSLPQLKVRWPQAEMGFHKE